MRKLTTEEFIKRAKEIHGNKYNYGLTKYINRRTKVKIICPIHGVFEQLPDIHVGKRKCGCPKCRYIRSAKSLTKTTENFIERAKKIHPEYDYSQVEYVTAKTKVKIICPKHGIFLIRPNNLLNGQGCLECGLEKVATKNTQRQYKPNPKRQTKEEFLKIAKEVHGDKYDYSLIDDYKGTHSKIKIICPKHGLFEQSARNHLKGMNCPCCSMSQGEEKIQNWLNKNNYVKDKDYFREYKFEELGLKRFDFYIPSKNFLIEYNGKQHYEVCYFNNFSHEGLKEQQNVDLLKKKFAEDKGINFLTIPYTKYDCIETILENEIGSL